MEMEDEMENERYSFYSSLNVVDSLPRSLTYSKYLSVVEIRLCPRIFESKTRETPCLR